MRKILFLGITSIGMSLYGAQDLDKVMPTHIQKQTGVDQLTPKQKKALSNWLHNNMPVTQESKYVSLSENIQNGKILKLSDGTYWEVAPTDQNISSAWLFPFPVEIVPSKLPGFPYKLINKNTGSSIFVQKLESNLTKEKP